MEYIIPLDVLRICWDNANAEFADCRHQDANEHELIVLAEYRRNVERHQDAMAALIVENSPEYQVRREAERVRQETLDAEFTANMATWQASQLRRRQHDMEISQKGRVNIAILCHEMEDFHWEFFEEFFSKEYCGWDVKYDGQWKGYWFPKEIGDISELLFSTTGTLFRSDGTEKGERLSEWNYVMTYGALVCGYPLNSMEHLSPNDYRRAIHGLNAWLKQEQGKRDGTFIEHGTSDYWEQFLGAVTLALFGDELDKAQCIDSPRNIYRLVAARWSEGERSPYPEILDEKSFTAFLRGCLEGGEHYERASHYFKTEDAGRKKVEKFQLTLNPECIPAPELTREEENAAVDHAVDMIKSSHVAYIPPKMDIKTQMEGWYQVALENSKKDPFHGDDNARAEAGCESQD